MLVVEENPLIMNFFEEHGLRLLANEEKAVKAFVYGLLVNERASVKHVAENTVRGQSERQMNRILHRLSARARDMFLYNFRSLQTIPSLAIRPKGVIALDEHVIPKMGKEIEGVDYFYSTTHNKGILGLSMITTHYYGGPFEYPLDCLLYRRPQELEKRHHSERYVPKNELARQLIQEYHAMGFPCKTWVMDSYFMTKENVKLLSSLGYFYVSKIKRNWVVTYHRKRWKVEELYEDIAESEFEHVEVTNPKTKEKRHYLMAHRDVFVPKIGVQRVLFLREVMRDTSGKYYPKYKKGWTGLVSNMLNERPKGIIQAYLKRWTIETSYRDESQELHLKGCMFRNIEGQYCFITLVFLAYRLLTWAARLGLLSPYHPDVDTLGKKRAAFRRFHEEVFGAWITSLKEECRACKMARVIYMLIHGGDPHAIDSF